MTIWRLIKQGAARQEGFTVVELVVGMTILSIVLAAFMGALVSAQNNLVIQENRTKSNDQVRQALFSLDREIRSANLIHDPAGESVPSYGLTVYTQANAPTRTPPNQCVEWQIDDFEKLNVRRWDPADLGTVSKRAPVADDIVNRLASVPAFTLNNSTATPVIDIVLLSNARYTAGSSETVRVTSSVAARNYLPSTMCTPRPPG
jgi:prepilin-type N-terminal cleavage/methylation domain-containing protein